MLRSRRAGKVPEYSSGLAVVLILRPESCAPGGLGALYELVRRGAGKPSGVVGPIDWMEALPYREPTPGPLPLA